MFSVNYIFLLNITYVFAIITCLGFLVLCYAYYDKQFRIDKHAYNDLKFMLIRTPSFVCKC